MLEFGFGLSPYEGTHQVDPGGGVTLRDFPGSWPAMKLGQDRDSLLLEPAGPNIRFVMGGRCASHLSEGKGSYGPFRMLSGADEEEVLAELGHQSL